jgi:spore germination protein YaaH
MTVDAKPEKPIFREIWAYLLRGEESALTGVEPITDVCYFAVNLTRDGRITDKVKRPGITLQDGTKPAVHLVVAELSNDVLLHFALDPRFGIRPQLIKDIVRVLDGFNGVQIDFEAVAPDDSDNFIDFLKELKKSLPAGRALSVAVPARTRRIADAYDYTRIAPVVDRMVVMAYDEHWSSSAPGPVASLSWCSNVVDYAAAAVGPGKIIMGLPLYGRAWQDKRLARALRYTNVQDLIAEKASAASYSSDLGPWFEYQESVVVTVYYDDERSILEKLLLYRSRDVSAVSFWRLGQGPAELWAGIASTGRRVSDRVPKSPAVAM